MIYKKDRKVMKLEGWRVIEPNIDDDESIRLFKIKTL
jgi:hypothetical protein